MMASEASPLVAKASDSSLAPDDTYGDSVDQITRGRRLSRWLSKFSWYNPHLNSSETSKPSIDAAWAYFEHVTLARRFVNSQKEKTQRVHNKDSFQKAEAGEKDEGTVLYSVVDTPERDLADFGLGVGIYFFTLRALAIIMLIAGLINTPNLIYYASDRYNNKNEGVHAWSLKASAICTNYAWKSCPTCTREDWDRFPATYDRYAVSRDENGDMLTFIKINQCEVGPFVGLVAFVSMLFVCISVYILQKVIYQKERLFDESNQTTTDYAVVVQNPPKDARNVEEWKAFFTQYGDVTCCTVALDNEELVAALIARRVQMIALQNLQPPNTVVHPRAIDEAVQTAKELPWYMKLLFIDAQKIKENIAKIDNSIEVDFGQRDYDVSSVFVIFETEEAQQLALKWLSVKGLDLFRQDVSSLPDECLFRGKHLLSVIEPPEPSSVRWQDLGESLFVKLKQRVFTFFLTVAIVVASCMLVTYVRFRYGIVYAALTITAINSGAPTMCKYITNVESHESEGTKQASLYYKVTACVWITSAIITAFITPFVHTLNDDPSSLIPAMCAIFITEMFKSPVTQLLDVSGNIYRHVLGPRAPDQRRMNIYFQGTAYLLSERYSDMTNVLFMTFYYAAIFPAGFFFAAITLTVHYWNDKYCLLRSWAPAPMLNNSIADISRIYFFSSALAVYAIMSSYNFASFPYDNACKLAVKVSADYVGTFRATTGEGLVMDISIPEGDATFKYCNQDMSRYSHPAFPAITANQPTGGEWMGPEQNFTYVFGWTSVWVLGFVVAIWLNSLRKIIEGLLFSTYKPHIQKQTNEKFSDLKDLVAYVPQSRVAGDLYPLLFCDVSDLDHELIGWEDPDDALKTTHNAIYDVEGLVNRSVDQGVFSFVKHWAAGNT